MGHKSALLISIKAPKKLNRMDLWKYLVTWASSNVRALENVMVVEQKIEKSWIKFMNLLLGTFVRKKCRQLRIMCQGHGETGSCKFSINYPPHRVTNDDESRLLWPPF